MRTTIKFKALMLQIADMTFEPVGKMAKHLFEKKLNVPYLCKTEYGDVEVFAKGTLITYINNMINAGLFKIKDGKLTSGYGETPIIANVDKLVVDDNQKEKKDK